MRGMDRIVRRVNSGDVIKPWLILGPYYEDMSQTVQGLTLFERDGATVGRATMTEIVQEGAGLLGLTPREGDTTAFRGRDLRWTLVRRPEKYLSWGTYNISNHVAAAVLSTRVTPEQPGERHWRLVLRISCRALVAVDGRTVFDSERSEPEYRNGAYRYAFDAPLDSGKNVVNVALFRLGRMARVGFRLETDTSLECRVALPKDVSRDTRARIEAELRGVRLDTDIFHPGQEVAVRFERALAQPVRVSLLDGSGEHALHSVITSPQAQGVVSIVAADALEDGHYQIACDWSLSDDRVITRVCYQVQKLSPTPALPGDDYYERRRRLVLEHYAASETGARPIFGQVARYALGRYDAVDEGVIRDTCDLIAARKDCADFVIQGLLRLLYWERESPRLSAGLRALMKDTVIGFKYWVDEPGDTVMYMGSENHRLLFHVAEWMAGQLYPTEEFTNSRQRGLYHATKGRMYIAEWLRQRGRYGFDEWHSNSYYPVSMAPLINVYDFAIHEDAKLRDMAGCILDYMLFVLAQDTFRGVFGTTHGRSYGRYIKYPEQEGTSATCWLAYGTGYLAEGTSGMCPVSMATSQYRAPAILTRMALDNTTTVESYERQGYHRAASPPHANLVVYRTPDYMMSAVQNLRKGEYEPSTHVAQVTLGKEVVIFWSCPHTSGEGSGLRPDYWSGHTTLPRVIQYRNVMSLTWHLCEFAWMTHCFLEQHKCDEVRITDRWCFVRVNKGYVGIWSEHGLSLGDEGQYAGRELVCFAEDNTWIVECGRDADWGSFDAFCRALRDAEITSQDHVISYQSPSVGTYVTGWDVVPTVEGHPLPLDNYPLVQSEWADSSYGSGRLQLRYGDERHTIYFEQ